MENPQSSHLSFAPSDTSDTDYEALDTWVNTELDAAIAEDNVRFDAQFEAERVAAEQIAENARAQGLVPDGPTLDRLAEFHLAEEARARDEQARIEEHVAARADAFGVLRQPLPAQPNMAGRRPPFKTESEDQKDGGTGKSFADRSTGLMRIAPDTSFSGSWDWARCSIGQEFVLPTSDGTIEPVCEFRNHLGMVTAWGLFSDATVQLELLVFTFNMTRKVRWVKRTVLSTVTNAWIGTVGMTLGLGPTFRGTGFGQVDKGDRIVVTATLIGRAKAPTGRAALNHSCNLTSITVT
jgi:hypothetical protein